MAKLLKNATDEDACGENVDPKLLELLRDMTDEELDAEIAKAQAELSRLPTSSGLPVK